MRWGDGVCVTCVDGGVPYKRALFEYLIVLRFKKRGVGGIFLLCALHERGTGKRSSIAKR